jgi:hypothetical protein
MIDISASAMQKFFANLRLWFGKKRLVNAIMSEVTETFLEFLLWGMRLYLIIDPDYRRNIQDFNGLIRLRDRAGKVNVLVKFAHGKMTTSEDPAPEANVTIFFKNESALRNYLIASKKDILKSLLHNEINIIGNFNYLYKFAFMANHLLLEFQPQPA